MEHLLFLLEPMDTAAPSPDPFPRDYKCPPLSRLFPHVERKISKSVLQTSNNNMSHFSMQEMKLSDSCVNLWNNNQQNIQIKTKNILTEQQPPKQVNEILDEIVCHILPTTKTFTKFQQIQGYVFAFNKYVFIPCCEKNNSKSVTLPNNL